MGDMHDRLKQARQGAGYISAAKAAEALGVGTSAYRAHETGQNKYGPDEAAHSARKFGVRASYLLLGDEPGAQDASELIDAEALADRLNKLQPARRKRVYRALMDLLAEDEDSEEDALQAPRSR